jgi:histidinol-phosphate aminotransferase
MSVFRPDVDRLQGYVPGLQPQEPGWVKLNTNENPYPPSPEVAAAVEAAARGRLNIYPDPLAGTFCEQAAELFQVEADCILPANGSDENLTIITRTFVDPQELIAYPYPSYVLYETLAEIQGAKCERMLLNPDWSWDRERARKIALRAKLVFVPNPNSPSGNRWSDQDILALVPPQGVLVLDEAYGDFCDQPHRAELLKSGHEAAKRIIITRTLSKSYSLAGVRFGFAIAHPELIQGMRKVKDSYNCDALSLAAASAALKDQNWMQANVAKIRQTRNRLAEELRTLGFDVVGSQANFVWATHPDIPHTEIYEELRKQKVLVRYMKFPHVPPGRLDDGLRITVGTNEETDTLLKHLGNIMLALKNVKANS